jgi:hypothetical protein
MTSYDLPVTEYYGESLGAQATGTAFTINVEGPKGRVGLVRDFEVEVTSSITATTIPEIDVGISSGDFSYGRFRLGTNVSTAYALGIQRASQIVTGPWNGLNPHTMSDFSGHISLGTALIPANTAIVVSSTTSSGGGAIRVKVQIDWF